MSQVLWRSQEEADIATSQSELDAPEDSLEVRRPMWRRILAVVIALFAILAILLSFVIGWEKRVLGDEDQFVATFAELPSDEAVATALSVRIADRIVERSGVDEFVVASLPDPLDFLAVPLTATISNSISDITYGVVSSDGFSTVWEATLRTTHRSVTQLLSGNDDGAISTEGGTVAISLDNIAAAAVARVEDRGISLPNLDIEFGEIVLYESEQLGAVQDVAQTVDRLGWLIPLIALVLIAAALWASTDRRWMTSFLGFGTALAALIALASLRTGRNAIFGGIKDEVSRNAGLSTWDTVTELFVQAAWALFVVSLVIGFVAWVLGPSRQARKLNAWTRSTIDLWGEADGSEVGGVSEFLAERKRSLEIGVVVLAVLFVLFGPTPSGLSVLVTAVIMGVIVGVIEVMAGPSHAQDNAPRVDANDSA